jgi:hypothetical protein
MKAQEVLRKLGQNRDPNQCFIRWWRTEGSLPKYELVWEFLENVSADEEFSGFELLTLDQMWETLEKMAPERISRESRMSGDFILWTHHSGAGELVVEECPVSPESLMMIYDIETNPRQGHSLGSLQDLSKHGAVPA